jgi:hypothetical protein
MEHAITLDEVKSKIDIISLAERYGFEFKSPSGTRYRAVKNLFRDDKTSSLDFFSDSQRYYDRGDSSLRGDAIDMIAFFEGLDQNEAIAKAKEISGTDTYKVETRRDPIEQKPKEKKIIDFDQLANNARKELQESIKYNPRLITINQALPNGFVKETQNIAHIHSEYHKLFETSSLEEKYYKKLSFIFKNILGYSTFWKSPTIILRDRKNRVVDLVAYRPRDKDTLEEIKGMKYYYKNFLERGEDFVYPFEDLVKRIAEKEKYIVVGEGLKNALNALVYNVAYITIESTGNILNISPALIEEINIFLEKGFGLVTAFDGDPSGEKAYHQFISLTGFVAENVFSFDSNIDFVEYVRGSK